MIQIRTQRVDQEVLTYRSATIRILYDEKTNKKIHDQLCHNFRRELERQYGTSFVFQLRQRIDQDIYWELWNQFRWPIWEKIQEQLKGEINETYII